MQVGILGTNFGAFHASLYSKQPSVDTILIWGRNLDKLKALENNPVIKTTTEINDVLCNSSIDLVDVCLPSSLHREYVIHALESGKNVFCETPLCGSASDSNAILEVEKKSGKRLFVNQFIKFIPEYRYLRDAVEDGRYGRLLFLKAWRNTAPIWGNLGNGTIASSLMIHDLDFITWLLGVPQRLAAYAKEKSEQETAVEATLFYDDTLVTASASSMMPPGYPFTTGFNAYFDQGYLQSSCFFEDDGPIRSVVEYADGTMRTIQLPLIDPYESSLAHVLDCCQSGRKSDISGESAAKALKVAIDITNLIQS